MADQSLFQTMTEAEVLEEAAQVIEELSSDYWEGRHPEAENRNKALAAALRELIQRRF